MAGKLRRAFVRSPVVVMLPRRWGPLEAPLDDGIVRVVLQVLSFSIEQGRSTFRGVVGILAKF